MGCSGDTVGKKVTQAEFGKIIGTSRQYVSKLVKKGVISVDEDGKIDVTKAKKAIKDVSVPSRDNTRKSKITGDHSKLEKLTYTEILKRKNIEQIKLLKLQCKEKEGELVKWDDAKNKVYLFIRMVRDLVLNIPDRVSPILAAEKDPRKINDILAMELRKALEAAAKHEL